MVSTNELTQPNARTDCQSHGAELTSINDAAEATFIKSILYVYLFQLSHAIALYIYYKKRRYMLLTCCVA